VSNLNFDPPESVRKIVEAMVTRALARCDELGVSREDFYRVMLGEQQLRPKASLEVLFERIFRRPGRAMN
jgi:hypothetical protein